MKMWPYNSKPVESRTFPQRR